MYNSYCYNRKAPEEDKRIMDAVKLHHDTVAAKGYLVVMTSLVGSQNYDLDHEYSDIDTYSLILPPITDLANAREPYSGLFELSDGHCNIKDIRIAFNLLRKTSPNSVEYFTSKYKIYNPIFEPILHEYLDDNSRMWDMIHCNYNHMLYAMAGMAHQLTKRNMPAGKRFSHALRLDDMIYHFFNSKNAASILELRPGGDRDIALSAKRDVSLENESIYNNECEQIAIKLDRYRDNFTLSPELEIIQQRGLALIDSLQWKIFQKYLMETNI